MLMFASRLIGRPLQISPSFSGRGAQATTYPLSMQLSGSALGYPKTAPQAALGVIRGQIQAAAFYE